MSPTSNKSSTPVRVQNQLIPPPAHDSGEVETSESFAAKLFSFFNDEGRRSTERRCNKRVVDPPLRAYLGVFGSTQPIPVGNISSSGFYLRTQEHWMPGTNMPLRLERTDHPGFEALHCVAVPTRVVRSDHYGVGFSFVFKDIHERTGKPTTKPEGGWQGARWADRKTIEELVAELDSQS